MMMMTIILALGDRRHRKPKSKRNRIARELIKLLNRIKVGQVSKERTIDKKDKNDKCGNKLKIRNCQTQLKMRLNRRTS